MVYPEKFSSIKISLASPDRIRELSHGEVTRPDMISYRTLKPVPDGLFAENIFGPVKDWECACGKYKDVPYRHLTCEKCGVELNRAVVRRERMGHIELAAPVCHTWYLKGESPVIGLVLGMSKETLDRIIDFCAYVVLCRGRVADLRVGEVLTDAEVSKLEKKCRRYGGLSALGVRLGQGAEAVRELLSRVNISAECKKLRGILSRRPSDSIREAAVKRLCVLDAFRTGESKPEWMVLTVLPVLPPDLRPVAMTDAGFVFSDVNELYRRVIIRNNRLKKLMEDCADEEVIRNEKRLLQDAVNALMDNGALGVPFKGVSGRKLESLTSLIGGKRGTLQCNLKEKRVDYSGSSEIIADPDLKLHECALPKDMALELFKPFVMRRLIETRKVMNIGGAKRVIELRWPVVWKALEEAVIGHPVLLVREPAVQRGSVQAFEPRLSDSDAIKLSPLALEALGASEDCELSVHVPLSVEAQSEAKLLMEPSAGLLKLSDGKPVSLLSRDVCLGVYYLTMVRRGDGKYYKKIGERYVECEKEDEDAERYDAKAYVSEGEALLDCEFGNLDLHDEIKVRRFADFEGERVSDLVKTTAGRVIFNEAIPQCLGFVDRTKREEVTKYEISVGNYVAVGEKTLARIIERCHKTGGAAMAGEALEKIKTLGFRYATKAALTFSAFDAAVPLDKDAICDRAERTVRGIELRHRDGLIREKERHAAVKGAWKRATGDVADELKSSLDRFNPVSLMANPDAGGFTEEVTRLFVARGLVSFPRGVKGETYVRSSFLEGLSPLECFVSARAGIRELSFAATRHDDAGYFTRKLADAVCDVIITEKDCASLGGKIPGKAVETIKNDDGKIIETLYDRIKGRFASEDVKDGGGRVLFPANTFLDEDVAQKIVDEGVERVFVRSPLTCMLPRGVCAMCYGKSMATNLPAEIGEAVGVIAAISLGEPFVRYAERPFVGAAGDAGRTLKRIEELFEAGRPAGCATLCEVSGVATVERGENVNRVVVYDSATYSHLKTYTFGPCYEILVRSGDSVFPGTALSSGAPDPQDIMRNCGAGAVQSYILYEVRSAYRSLGFDINDRHIEVILRQMLRKVRIEDAGSTSYLPGDTLDMFYVEKINAAALSRGKKPVTAQRLLLGITKVAQSADSFLSAASLLGASEVISLAAIKSGKDPLKGIKENVILGYRIPAGTGLKAYGDIFLKMRETPGSDSGDVTPGRAKAREDGSAGAANGGDVILDPVFPDIDLSDGYTYTYADIPLEINTAAKKDKDGGDEDE